ncbi:unnamed protein product [Brachionus calyciflorus]|uniref:Saposin B-type domain-containing protein n=1 Tax=Brachionus calyciflorus TaxID=104777 RepID=A0A813W3M0_9BILA|nr:unnamed protein product [Brachionus calyciflorus]
MKISSCLTCFSLVFLMSCFSLVTSRTIGLEKVEDVNGGVNCAVCSVLLTIVDELALVYNETVQDTLKNVCNYLPEGLFRLTCQQAVKMFGNVIIEGLYSKETPDVICHALKFCRTDPGKEECHVLPLPKNSIRNQLQVFENKLKLKNVPIPKLVICEMDIFKPICEYLKKIFSSHEPAIDADSDGHSTFPTLRGSSWRGKDCNDLSNKIRPGIKPTNGDKATDSNCNGIFGKAPDSNKTYEDLFCKNSKPIGIAVLGDSINVYQLNSAVFEHLAFIIENELDWPQLSGFTGFMNNTWPVQKGPTNSIYLKLLENNRCIFRNPDTLNHMTKPNVFYENIVEILGYLDTVLPNGSHVMLTGLANGSVLYESLKNRIYPLGRVRNDINYGDMYTYLSCLQLNYLNNNGWMIKNATLRQLTTDYAMMLSGLVKNITLTKSYKNFDMAYTDVPILKLLEIWESMGGEDWQVIEPIDGFHINQNGNYLMADIYWDILQKEHPEWLGETNKYNQQIKKIFGDQGGH